MKARFSFLLLFFCPIVLRAQSFGGGWSWMDAPDSTEELLSINLKQNRSGGTYGELSFIYAYGNRMDDCEIDMLSQKEKRGVFRVKSGYTPGLMGTIQLQMQTDTTLFLTHVSPNLFWLPDSVVLTKYRPESEVRFLNRK